MQGSYRVHSVHVGNSSRRERRRTRGATVRPPMMGPLSASALLLRVSTSLTIGAAVVILVLIQAALETGVIAAMIFGRAGEGRLRRERQNAGARGDGDRELRRLLLLVGPERSSERRS